MPGVLGEEYVGSDWVSMWHGPVFLYGSGPNIAIPSGRQKLFVVQTRPGNWVWDLG